MRGRHWIGAALALGLVTAGPATTIRLALMAASLALPVAVVSVALAEGRGGRGRHPPTGGPLSTTTTTETTP
ncbi:hypothetical protein [Cyanobium gracile]|uniref:Uncharacterized protein n=1 Tax=Cyanobium gracile UHCC 0281 TaxID=3110309 RepID=A0ABU5SYE3_9CYAN|nr:hypothetical protein [Cyanobium gracile]MEA5443345.1 hypothetical protein [Cyanobium gracile UHCC 0281]